MATAPTQAAVFNLPNQLTAGRLRARPGAVRADRVRVVDWCLVVFALAAFTDWLDGYLARLQGLISTLGPQSRSAGGQGADVRRLHLLAAVGALQGLARPWMVTVVVARELIITGLRGFLENMGAEFGADWLGKLKMGLQCAALIAIFVTLTLQTRQWD